MAATCVLSVNTRMAYAAEVESGLEVSAKSAYLCDFESGTAVFSKNETQRLPIASMCKIMTLLLSFEAAEGGVLSYDEQISVSERAAGMGGSQVFLQENLSYRAQDLMKTVAVCSANDSCVALAERICGNESSFVDKMNARAKELGAENTLFANCTGLPKEPQYSCAKDVSVMLRALLRHEKYFEFSQVWLEEFVHPDGRTTTITNTNKLVRFYDGCDGGKTGFTQQAGFCLAATARRGDTRLVSVVIGEDDSKTRFADSKNMLNYAFNRYENKNVLRAGEKVEGVLAPVSGGKQKEISVCIEKDVYSFAQKGAESGISYDYVLNGTIEAPVRSGDVVGEVTVFCNGVEIGRSALLAGESVEKNTWWDSLLDGIKHWN